MAEYSKEKLYFLKLDKDFFKSYDIQIIEKSSPKGKDIVLFLIKLMCESCSHQGYLRFSKDIPYDNQMLSAITNTEVSIVDEGMKVLRKLKLVKTTKDKTIFIPKVEEMTLSKTEGAVKKEHQRVDKRWTRGGQGVDKCPPQGGQKVENCPLDNKILDSKIIDNKNININNSLDKPNSLLNNEEIINKEKVDIEYIKSLIEMKSINEVYELDEFITKNKLKLETDQYNDLVKLLINTED